MLTKLTVDGFKSFKDFSIELRRGLNVIVGPNGAGKTNIIKFLEFIANLGVGSLVEAVSRSGGAGAIFRQRVSGGITSRIRLEVHGSTSTRSHRMRSQNPLKYKYVADIEFSLDNNIVFFSKQHLVMETETTDESKTKKTKQHSLDIEWRLDSQGDGALMVNKLDSAFREQTMFASREGRAGALDEFLRAELKAPPKDRSFIFIFRHLFDFIDSVVADFISGRSYNIDPNEVRKSEDIASEPGIKSNGGGLAATLNAAKTAARATRHLNYPYRYYWYQEPRYEKRFLSDLVNYLRLVNNDIENIDVESDPVENRLRVFLNLAYDGSTLKLPLSLASDGTVKWLALVASVLTNTSVVAVEEPENFLHPFMQREIVNIIRSSCEKSSFPTFAIITTHSETLVNSVSPEELIIFSMADGFTRAVRPSNSEQLRKEIASTGFGLGYYFLSGAIE